MAIGRGSTASNIVAYGQPNSKDTLKVSNLSMISVDEILRSVVYVFRSVVDVFFSLFDYQMSRQKWEIILEKKCYQKMSIAKV